MDFTAGRTTDLQNNNNNKKNQRTRHGFLHQKFWGFFFCLLMGLKTYSVILSVGSLNKKRIKLVT